MDRKSPELPSGTQLVADPAVVSRRLGDEVALVHLETNRIYTLNRTGARLWELIAEGLDRDALERRLLEEFDVEEEQLAREVDQALSLFLENRLVVPADERR